MNKMFNFNGMPYKRSGRAGGKSVSMIGMLVLLLAALLVLPSCFDGDTETVTETVTEILCPDGTTAASADACPVDYDMVGELDEGECYMDGDAPGMIQGTDADECINGDGGDDIIKGMGGADTITGGAGNDTLDGGAGDDTITGGAGNDTLDGGDDNDELTGGTGNNTLDGGAGEDIATFLGARQVTVSLADGGALVRHAAPVTRDGYLRPNTEDSGVSTDTLANIENVKGTHGDDIINGDDNANLLKGLDGGDLINGNGGDDTILPNRPAMANDMGVLVANIPTATDPEEGDVDGESATDPGSTDGIDVIDGGDGSDTISYEGESAGVTVNLGDVVSAQEANPSANTPAVIAHVKVKIAGSDNDDMITVVNIVVGTEDMPVSTIENVTGGFGADTLTGNARANTLTGGGGGDMLTGGGGDDTLIGGDGGDTLIGGDGDDTYIAVENGDTVTETDAADAGAMDTVHYATLEDDPSTPATDESATSHTVPPNVEVAVGTPNADTLTAHAGGATILGRGGNDSLIGGAGVDTLVGCTGENTLNGGDGNDIFGVFKDDGNPDTIEDFTTGIGMDAADEIHLKGFDSGTVTSSLIPGNSSQAGIYVDTVLVAIVDSTKDFRVAANPGATPPVVAKNQAEGILDALGKNNVDGDPIVRIVEFNSAKCM